jgi:hypothetical protein
MPSPRPAARASRASRGAGKAKRRKPTKETYLQAPDWTPAAAVLFNLTLRARASARNENKNVYTRKLLTHDGERRVFTKLAAERAGPASSEIETLMSVLNFHVIKVLSKPSHARSSARQLCKQAVSVGGTAATAAPAAVRVQAEPPASPPGAWTEAHTPHPRPRQQLAPRPANLWREVVPDPSALPAHAVIVPERAASRIRSLRAKAGPSAPIPPTLRASLVHTSRLPTAVASAGDHFLMARTGTWASLAQVLGAFGVRHDSPAASTMLTSALMTERQWTECVGRAVMPCAAAAVVRSLEPALAGRMPASPAYASACAGVDLFAAAMDDLFDSWKYVAAWETDSRLREFLAQAYAPRGLVSDCVYTDATCRETARAAPRADIYVLTPSCRELSQRNHHRSVEAVRAATAQFDDMLEYVHAHRPLVVIVENVHVPEFELAVLAALSSLEGYDLQHYLPECSRMARDRVYATAVRRD